MTDAMLIGINRCPTVCLKISLTLQGAAVKAKKHLSRDAASMTPYGIKRLYRGTDGVCHHHLFSVEPDKLCGLAQTGKDLPLFYNEHREAWIEAAWAETSSEGFLEDLEVPQVNG